MNDEQLHQRIKYLMEHGGVWDDPLTDIRRGVRWAVGIGLTALVMGMLSIASHAG